MNNEHLKRAIRARPRNRAGELALDIYATALEAVRADRLIRAAVSFEGETLFIRDSAYDLARYRRVIVLGAGKASAGMAAALEEILTDRIADGIVATKHGHSLSTARIRIVESSHPVPAEDSVEAGRAIYSLAESAGANDLVICLLSGGASSLMELPADGISLQDLQVTTDRLMRAGADITQLNAVRSRLSRIKAGGLARAASPASIVCLAISDVLSNSIHVIGSGPCASGESGDESGIDVVSRLGVAHGLPLCVIRTLNDTPAESRPIPAVPHHIIGDIWTAIDAARSRALELELRPLTLTGGLTGEARAVGRLLGSIGGDMERAMPEHGCVIAGGETTVTVKGAGKGGRAQEMAAAAAVSLGPGCALLCGGTDGTDGPTDAAGGLVDRLTWARAIEAGVMPQAALEQNDSYRFLEAAESLVFTGPTHTNVNDLAILVRAGERSLDSE